MDDHLASLGLAKSRAKSVPKKQATKQGVSKPQQKIQPQAKPSQKQPDAKLTQAKQAQPKQAQPKQAQPKPAQPKQPQPKQEHEQPQQKRKQPTHQPKQHAKKPRSDPPTPQKAPKPKQNNKRKAPEPAAPKPTNTSAKKHKPESRLDKIQSRLEGGRFRFLNEMLYTSNSSKAYSEFQRSPELFDQYHSGFNNQIQKWPTHPLDEFISFIKSMPENTAVADFGCGEARLASTLKPLGFQVHSFDLVACNEHVTACDMAHTRLKSKTVDVSVFCLSLMGTNYAHFLLEANRVMRVGGTLLVAEVESRLADTEKNTQPTQEKYQQKSFPIMTKFLAHLGFDECEIVECTKMFVSFRATKTRDANASDVTKAKRHKVLAPCVYKKR